MKTDKASARPWVNRKSLQGTTNIFDKRWNLIACLNSSQPDESGQNDWVDVDLPKAKANASLIVRAVNAHDALVEALKNARDLLIEKRILVPETAIKIKQAILLAEGK